METTKLDSEELKATVSKLITSGRTDQALKQLSGSKVNSPWVQNAIAVCQIRLGNVGKAVDIYRQLIVSGVKILPETPTVYKVNFALALLLSGNYNGFSSTLMEVDAKEHVGKTELLAFARTWQSKFTFLQSVLFWSLGIIPKIPVDAGTSPGYLE